MKLKKYFLFLIFYLASCEIQIPLNFDEKSYLILDCILGSDYPVEVHFYNNPKNDDWGNIEIKDAEIKIYENDVFLEVLNYNETNRSYYSSFIPKRENTYSVSVTYNNVNLSSETIIPKVVQIDTITNLMINGTNESELINFIRFKDEKDTPNYYMLSESGVLLNGNDTLTYYDEEFFFSNDALINEWHGSYKNNHLIFNGELIDGKTYDFKISLYLDNFCEYDKIILFFTLHSLSKDAYLYYKTINEQAESDVFSEPVFVYNNIKNGVGIFAGTSQSDEYKIIYEKK